MKKKNESGEGIVARKRDYQVELNYSEKARKDKVIKFTALRKNKQFEISLEDFIKLIMFHLNKESIPMLQTKNSTIDMVQLERSITGVCNKDFKEGEEISFNYTTSVPIDLAIAEEAYNIARISGDEIVKIPLDYLKKAKEELDERQKTYLDLSYKNYMKQFKTDMTEGSEEVSEEAIEENIEKALESLESPYNESKE